MSDSLGPHELQHARPPCPSPTPRVHSNSHPWSLVPSNHLILSRPLFLLPPIPPSLRVFSSESTLRMRWPKYWRFSFSISPSNYYTLFISFGCTRSSLLSVRFLSWQRVEFTLIAVHGLLIQRLCLLRSTGLWCLESVVVVLGLSCPEACGIFPDLGWKLRVLHWRGILTHLLLYCAFHNISLLFSTLVVAGSLRPHGPQHARLPCPSPAPGVCSDSCPLSQ